MAGSYTDYLENAVVQHVFCGVPYTPAGTLYVAAFSTLPTDSGGGVEFTGTNYARRPIVFSATGSAASNVSDIAFAAAGSAWGTVVGFGIFDSLSTGNLLAWGDIPVARTIAVNDVLLIPAGAITITQS